MSLIHRTPMNINQAPLNQRLVVRSFSQEDENRSLSDVEARLMYLGFIAGQIIKVRKKAPVFNGPLLVEVRGRQVALSLAEAGMVEVEVET